MIEHIEDKAKKPDENEDIDGCLSARVVNEDIYTAAPKDKTEMSFCEKHATCPLNYYCKDDMCGKVLCEKCWTEKHAKHNVVLLSMRMQEISKNIKSQANQYKEQLTEYMSELVKAKEKVSSNKKSLKDAIRSHVKKNIEKLLLMNDKGVQDIEEIAAPEESNLEQEIEKLNDMKEKLSDASENITTLQKGKQQLHEINKLGDVITDWNVEYKLPTLKISSLSIDNDTIKVDFGTHIIGVKDEYDEETRKVPLNEGGASGTHINKGTSSQYTDADASKAFNKSGSKAKEMKTAANPCANTGTNNPKNPKNVPNDKNSVPVANESESDSEPDFNQLLSQMQCDEVLKALLGLDDFDICHSPARRIVFVKKP